MVVAQLEVSLKVQVLELDLVLGLAPVRPVALALMAKDMPLEWAVAWVAALVRARMAELAAVEAVDPDLVVADTTKLPFVEQARIGPGYVFYHFASISHQRTHGMHGRDDLERRWK